MEWNVRGGGELDPLSGGAKMSVLSWPSINWQDRDVTVRTAWMAWPVCYSVLVGFMLVWYCVV